jgi:trimeric autotransporter adhesin
MLCMCLLPQIVAIGAASGSDDTKGASRTLLSTMRVVTKGLLRTALMSICYGVLIAINGSNPAQLTPLTQIIMGGFQYASLLTLIALSLYILNAKMWKRITSVGEQNSGGVSAKSGVKALLASAARKRSSVLSAKSSRRSSTAAQGSSAESLQRQPSKGALRRQKSYTVVVAVQPRELVAPLQRTSTARTAAGAGTGAAAMQLEDIADSELETPSQRTVTTKTLVSSSSSSSSSSSVNGKSSNRAATAGATTAAAASSRHAGDAAPSESWTAARRRSSIRKASSSDSSNMMAAATVKRQSPSLRRSASAKVVPTAYPEQDSSDSTAAASVGAVAAATGTNAHSAVAAGSTYQRVVGLLTSSSSRVSPTAESDATTASSARNTATSTPVAAVAAVAQPTVPGKRGFFKPLSNVIERPCEDV